MIVNTKGGSRLKAYVGNVIPCQENLRNGDSKFPE